MPDGCGACVCCRVPLSKEGEGQTQKAQGAHVCNTSTGVVYLVPCCANCNSNEQPLGGTPMAIRVAYPGVHYYIYKL